MLMPPGYAAADPSERTALQAQCVFEHYGDPGVEVTDRFLQVQRRSTCGPDPLGPAVWDEEKAAARATDPRAAALIDRVEAMDAATMEQLHGTLRSALPVEQVPWWDPGADASVSPGTDAVLVAGQRVARGSRVILRPGARRADAQDSSWPDGPRSSRRCCSTSTTPPTWR